MTRWTIVTAFSILVAAVGATGMSAGCTSSPAMPGLRVDDEGGKSALHTNPANARDGDTGAAPETSAPVEAATTEEAAAEVDATGEYDASEPAQNPAVDSGVTVLPGGGHGGGGGGGGW